MIYKIYNTTDCRCEYSYISDTTGMKKYVILILVIFNYPT